MTNRDDTPEISELRANILRQVYGVLLIIGSAIGVVFASENDYGNCTEEFGILAFILTIATGIGVGILVLYVIHVMIWITNAKLANASLIWFLTNKNPVKNN